MWLTEAARARSAASSMRRPALNIRSGNRACSTRLVQGRASDIMHLGVLDTLSSTTDGSGNPSTRFCRNRTSPMPAAPRAIIERGRSSHGTPLLKFWIPPPPGNAVSDGSLHRRHGSGRCLVRWRHTGSGGFSAGRTAGAARRSTAARSKPSTSTARSWRRGASTACRPASRWRATFSAPLRARSFGRAAGTRLRWRPHLGTEGAATSGRRRVRMPRSAP